jgi:hypothetical protein
MAAAGAVDESATKYAAGSTAVTTPAAIPSGVVNLADYGGTPGASPSAVISAFNQAFNQLKNMGGGTLNIAAGTYSLGNQPSEVIVIGVNDLRNVLISGYGAKITMNTTASTGMPVFLHFQNPNNVTIAGLSFQDFGTNLSVNWKGGVCISVNTTVACSGFKTVDCLAESVGTFWRSMPSTRYTLTNCDINATVRTAYYGLNCNYNGRFSKCNLNTTNVRRAFIAYGTRDWEIVVNGSADGVALGSNAYLEMVPDAVSPVENVKIYLTMTGNVSKYLGLVHFYHQGPTGTFQYCRNVKAHVVFNNVSGTGNMFIFDHEYPAGTIPSTTIRSFEQITLTGSINGGSFGGRIISNPSVSSASTNLVNVSSTFSTYQNLGALPGYFKVFTPSTQCPA